MRFARFASLLLLVLFLTAGCNDGAKRVRIYQNAREYFIAGNDRFKAGDYEKAIAEFNHAIEIDPEFPMVYWKRSKAYEKMGNIVHAINDMQKYIELISKMFFRPNSALRPRINSSKYCSMTPGRYSSAP